MFMQVSNKNNGFTLIELMVVISIVAILATIAIPNFTTLIKNTQMRSQSNDVLGFFKYARATAIKRNETIHIGSTDGQNWQQGMAIWVDGNSGTANQFDPDSDETLRIATALPQGFSLTQASSQQFYTFKPNGELSSANTLTLCDSRTGETGRQITLLESGLAVLNTQYHCT
ncbi:MAG: type II transport protein GspH [Pseudomonadales bacterium]|nr:type II transport protein GspH [Pseudomonadales bacterium]